MPRCARGLDEARGGDRLARRGRVPEAEAADGSGIGARELLFDQLVLDEAGVEVVVRLLVGLGIGRRRRSWPRGRFRCRSPRPGAASPR